MITTPLLCVLASLVAMVSSTSSFSTATCVRSSISACPTTFNPCCAYICAEAQVPFEVCSPDNETVDASCSKCPTGKPTTSTLSHKTTTSPSSHKTSTSKSIIAKSTTTKTTSHSATITTAPKSTLSASTCSGRLLSTAGCPTPYDPCCQYVCEEAQVPYDVCSLTDGTGEYATCSKCPTPAARF